MSDLVEGLRKAAAFPEYPPGPYLQAAVRIEQLERVLAQALATLKDGDMDMVHATIAAIEEAMK